MAAIRGLNHVRTRSLAQRQKVLASRGASKHESWTILYLRWLQGQQDHPAHQIALREMAVRVSKERVERLEKVIGGSSDRRP